MKSKHKIYWLIPLILIAFGMSVLLFPKYNIKTISVETNDSEIASEIAKSTKLKIGENVFWTLLKEGNIFNMRFTGAEKRLREKYINYCDFNVKLILPSEVYIQYSKRKPVFEIAYGEIYLVADEKGCVLDSQKEHKRGFLRVTGMDLNGFNIGCFVAEKFERFRYVIDIYRVLESYDIEYLTSFREYIDWVDLSQENGVAILYDDRILVKLDVNKNIASQTAAMCSVLANEIGYFEKGTLDFTVGENPVFSKD